MAEKESGSSGLVASNYGLIFVYTAAHIFLAYFVIFQQIPDEAAFKHVGAVLAGGAVGTVFTVLITELPGAVSKARLVYLRWKHPLPGHRAFTEHLVNDPGHRIQENALREKHPNLPTNSEDQNKLWYQFLQKHDSRGAVQHTHRLYLLFRDLTWIALLLLVATFVVACWGSGFSPPVIWLLALLAAELLTVRFLAARAGVDLVQTVLAFESHKS